MVIEYKIQEEGLSPKTITNLHLCLHKAMQQAVLEHHLNFNPCDAVNLPRNEKPQIEILTREEQERHIYKRYQFRYGVFIRLVLATGIRLGELLGLRWEDINLRTGIMYIRRTLNRLPKADYCTDILTFKLIYGIILISTMRGVQQCQNQRNMWFSLQTTMSGALKNFEKRRVHLRPLQTAVIFYWQWM